MKINKKRIAVSFLSASLGLFMACSSLAVAAENPVKVPGDINGDDTFTAADMVVMKQYFINAAVVDADELLKADVTEDDAVNVKDLVRMKKMLLTIPDVADGNQETII